MDVEQGNLDLGQLLGALRRRAPWILACVVLATIAAYAFSKHQTKQYTATATLVFNNNQLSQQIAGLPVASSNEQQARQNTNLKLVQLGDMAERTAVSLGGGLTKEKVKKDLSVSAQGESNIIEVAATAPSPTLAAAIANGYTTRFVQEQQGSNHAYYTSALALVEKQLKALSPRERASTAGLALQDRAQSLGVLAELRNSDVQIAQAASVPNGPSSPKTSRNTILGAIVGLLAGLSLALLLERFDQRIREPDDLEKVYGLPLLGVIPESRELSRQRRVGGEFSATQSSGEAEAFHLIRAHMRYFNVDRELRTLMVVSAGPGDGKTTIARHLSGAAARMGSRVLLVEADLRRPTIAKQLDIAPGRGLSDVLIGSLPVTEAIRTVELDGASGNGSRALVFDVLAAGATLPPNPGELIESRAMGELLEQARSDYDLVVIDTPPLTAVSDAFPLLKKVDGVIIVGRVGRNRRDVAVRLHETLLAAGAPLLGVVANGFKARRLGGYGYGYGGYDYAPTKPEEEPSSMLVSANGVAEPETQVPTARGEARELRGGGPALDG